MSKKKETTNTTPFFLLHNYFIFLRENRIGCPHANLVNIFSKTLSVLSTFNLSYPIEMNRYMDKNFTKLKLNDIMKFNTL
jgi:hypothetical protein